MKYTVSIITAAGIHPSQPMSRADMESLTKQIKGTRFNAATFPESLISFQSLGGGITFLFPAEIIGWEVEKSEDAPCTGQAIAEYSVLGES